LATEVDEAEEGQPDEERTEVGFVAELPMILAQALQETRPNRLNDVAGIKFSPESPGELAPYEHAEMRLVGREDLVDRIGIAVVQPLMGLERADVVPAIPGGIDALRALSHPFPSHR
jgi:hypothetical protein